VGKDVGFFDVSDSSEGMKLSNIGSMISPLLEFIDLVESDNARINGDKHF
jgi:hypothetical protein